MGPKNRRETLGLGGLFKQSQEDSALDAPLSAKPRLAPVNTTLLVDDAECAQCGVPLLTPTTPCPKCTPNNAKQATIAVLSSEPTTGTKTSLFSTALAQPAIPEEPVQADNQDSVYLNLPSVSVRSTERSVIPIVQSPAHLSNQAHPPSITDTLLTLSMGFVGICVMGLGVAQFLVEDPGVGSVAHGLQSIAIGLTVLGVRRIILNQPR